MFGDPSSGFRYIVQEKNTRKKTDAQADRQKDRQINAAKIATHMQWRF